MERTIEQKKELLTMNFHILERLYDEKGLSHDESPDFQKAQTVLEEVNSKIEFIENWQDRIIENSGGYDDKGYLLNWNQNVVIAESGSEGYEEMEKGLLTGEKSLIIALIELSNLELNYLQNAYSRLQNALSTPEVESEAELLLARSVKTDNYEIDGPVLWNLEKFPANKFTINGHTVISDNHQLNFTNIDWEQLVKNSLTIEVPMPKVDTTLVFHLSK
jgi:hypothetical protein